MKQKKILVSMVVLSSLTACSVHPLPDDVTPDDTLSIVEKIHCEAKGFLKGILLDVLSKEKHDEQAMAVYRLIRYENHDFGDAEFEMMGDRAYKRLLPWLESGIGMTFVLTGTEINNGSASAKFGLPFTDGAFNLSLSAGRDLTRKNARTVKLTENWGGVAKLRCSEAMVTRRNLLYPITGTVGLGEVLTAYYELNTKIGRQIASVAPQEFTDKLTFTTKLSGGMTPSYELKPVSDRFQLAKAEGTFGGSREDQHELVIALTAPEKPKPKTDDLEVKLADNVTLIVKVPKGKFKGAKPSPKPAARRFDPRPSPELSDRLLKAMDKVQTLDAIEELE